MYVQSVAMGVRNWELELEPVEAGAMGVRYRELEPVEAGATSGAHALTGDCA